MAPIRSSYSLRSRDARLAEENREKLLRRYQGYSLINLPEAILMKILLNLPLKAIVACKNTCRALHGLISDPHFTEEHDALSKSNPHLLIRPLDRSRISRTLYLVDPAKDLLAPLPRCTCLPVPHRFPLSCHSTLGTKLNIPMHNAEVAMRESKANPKVCLRLPTQNHRYRVVNSCDGLLFLSDLVTNEPLIVCNPVTGEFVHLPLVARSNNETVDCALGFGGMSYKVVRISSLSVPMVHTVGTVGWRAVGGLRPPGSARKLAFPTWLEGMVYFFCGLEFQGRESFVVAFNVEKEEFRRVALPPGSLPTQNLSMGVLQGRLCLCDASGQHDIILWVLTGDGTWRRETTVDVFHNNQWPYGVYQPVHRREDGTVVMFRPYSKGFVHSDPNRAVSTSYLRLNGISSRFEMISFTPTFRSLRSRLPPGPPYSQILNVNSRCGNVKVRGETKPVFLEGRRLRDGFLSPSQFQAEETFWSKHFWSKW